MSVPHLAKPRVGFQSVQLYVHTAGIQARAGRRSQQSLRGSQREHTWQHSSSAVAAYAEIATVHRCRVPISYETDERDQCERVVGKVLLFGCIDRFRECLSTS